MLAARQYALRVAGAGPTWPFKKANKTCVKLTFLPKLPLAGFKGGTDVRVHWKVHNTSTADKKIVFSKEELNSTRSKFHLARPT